MNGKKGKPCDFGTEYKALPIKKRVGLIKVARNLLKLQKDNAAMFADSGSRKKAGAV
jgi:hypothetical protein